MQIYHTNIDVRQLDAAGRNMRSLNKKAAVFQIKWLSINGQIAAKKIQNLTIQP